MIHFTRYAEQKFDILNRHQSFLRKEEIEETILNPEKIKKRGKYFFAQKDNIKVVFRKEEEINIIITFYPIK